MNIPKEIKVGPVTFRVSIESIKLKDGRSANGHTSFSKLLIRVDNGMVREKQELTYCHELIHAMCEIAGMNSSKTVKEKEYYAANLAPILYSVLKDNGPKKITKKPVKKKEKEKAIEVKEING